MSTRQELTVCHINFFPEIKSNFLIIRKNEKKTYYYLTISEKTKIQKYWNNHDKIAL